MAPSTVLVIADDEQQGKMLEELLHFVDCDAVVGATIRDWRSRIAEGETLRAAFIATRADTEQLKELVPSLREHQGDMPIILVVKDGQAGQLDPQLGRNIFHTLIWPLKYRQLNDVLQQVEIFHESRAQSGKRRSPELFRSLVGNSRNIREVRNHIEQVAKTDANVLILGESGTGKEVVARNLHYYSARREQPFVPINCGAIPPDLLESELFGHEKGAFTGAISARRGRFEMAENGTLFLDEIGDMSLHMQVKLLRVLQERTFERVGSNKMITTNVRFIAATHRNLEEAIREGTFREDLYYRLNVFPIEMPPLRERAEDIPLLVHELITRLEHEKRGSVRLTQGAMMALCQYHWPGNVRELANLVERLIILFPFGLVDMKDLPEKFRCELGVLPEADQETVEAPVPMPYIHTPAVERLPREGIDLKKHLNDLECNLIEQALDDSGGVVSHAAQRLGLRRTTLVEKLRKYNIQRVEEMTES